MSFFNLSKALGEVKDALGAKETTLATAKLVGKGAANVAKFAATTGFDHVMKDASNKVLNNENSTEEQRANAIKMAEKTDARIAARKRKQQELENQDD